jgi:putative ABC transport system permease protein
MVNTQIFNIIWKQFTQRKLRSILTIVGITIGICALVSLILLSTALKNGVTGFLDSLGSDVILLAPNAALSGGAPSGVGVLTTDDVEIIESIAQVRTVNSYVGLSRNIEFGRETERMSVTGVEIDEDYPEYINTPIHAGRYLESSDSYSVNIGYKLAHDEFDKEITVNSFIKISDRKYRVVGIFVLEGDQEKDNSIYLPIDDLRRDIGNSKAVTAMDIRITPGSDLVFVNEKIIETLKRRRGQKDFSTITPDQLRNQIGEFLSVIDIVVISIACISLVVGALGIMNSLYTSVLQRTKEIGTMKSVGATNLQILTIFVSESAILGFMGGLAGILSGIVLAYLFVIPINLFGFVKLKMTLDPMLFLAAMTLSVTLGIFAGFLPALRASRLKPVDALRYE